jgi:fatty-acyl-CoA synthase
LPWSPKRGREFAALFFGAIYAGGWPVPLPLPTSFGGRKAISTSLACSCAAATRRFLFYPAELGGMAGAAPMQRRSSGIDMGITRREAPVPCRSRRRFQTTSPICNIRADRHAFPHGVASPTGTAQQSCRAQHGMEVVERDRCISGCRGITTWDWSAVSFAVANQGSADYLKTEDFARRPLRGST